MISARRLRPYGWVLLVLPILLSCFTSGARGDSTAVFGPEWLPIEDGASEDLRSLARSGDLPLRFWSASPVTRVEAAQALSSDPDGGPLAHRLARELAGERRAFGLTSPAPEVSPLLAWPLESGRVVIRAYASLDGRWRDSEPPRYGDRARLGLRGTAHLSPHWSLHEDIYAGYVPGGLRFADAIVAHTDLLIFLESVYVGYQRGGFEARVGRMREAWGPGLEDQLLLSDSAAAFDQLTWGIPLGRLRFRSTAGPLSLPARKNLALHRLEWTPTANWTLAFSEGAIYPGDFFQPLYVSGLVPYTLVERLHGQDAIDAGSVARVRNNVLLQVDLLGRPRPRLAAWASLLLDDVATESSVMPSRLGLSAGVEKLFARNARSEWRASLEGFKVTNYAYSVYYQEACPCDWSHQGRALGLDDGPDVERLAFTLRYVASRNAEYSLRVLGRRKGEGRLGIPWTPPAVGDTPLTEPASAWQPSGTATEELAVRFGLRLEPSAAVAFRFEATANGEQNVGHRPGATRRGLAGRATLSWHR